jgi:ribonuclease HII
MPLTRTRKTLAVQPTLFGAHARITCGVDEAGRGPLAGAVYAAAVILDPGRQIRGLKDSKVLNAQKREDLAAKIKDRAQAWCIAYADVEEIDRLNILQASLLAMKRAVEGLSLAPEMALVDGNQAPALSCWIETVIEGDAKVPSISAASILAKTARDAALVALHERFPVYGFDQHKGYPTPDHLARLRQHGPCEVHRRSFAPVASLLDMIAKP